MKVGAIVQARMTSSRLPGKVLRQVVGKPMLAHLVERATRATLVEDIVVATTTNPADDQIEAACRRLGVNCFRGSEEDVLGRVLGAARKFRIDLIVELTGDNVLIDPFVIDRVVQTYLDGDVDYVSNALQLTYPLGLNVQVFSTETLAEVDQLTADPVDREHVSLYIYEHPERFKLRNVESGLPPRYSGIRLTVDTADDFDVITAVYEALYADDPQFGLTEVLQLFDRQPELAGRNRHVQQRVPRM